MMKRVFALVLSLVLLCGLCACGGDGDKPADKATTTAYATATTATEKPTAATQPGDTTGSTATEGTATTTTPNEDVDPIAIRILAIGDGLAVDAMEKHLFAMLADAGYNAIHLGMYLHFAHVD